uniref:ZP domain-containing protein n=1 Tax=Panagrolaimus sp. JU765 TaxID=591449 RepID=A0AC34QLD6_9BILA
MEVSEMTTQSIEGKAKLPECVYTIHKDSPNGPIVKFAVVGQALYHVWDCPSTVYKMMLHSCYADNGAGTKYQVVDDKGCAIEDYLMPQINYNNELTRGVVATSAFGFADKTSMMFACEIQLCFKEDVDCANIMPPKCGTSAFPNPEENKIIGNDLETDQLIASSSSSSTSTTTSTSTVSQATSKHPKSLDTMPADFPRPNVLPFDEIEGSGEDKAEIISTTTTSTTTAPIKILEKSSARTQRHSGPKPRSLVNLDVQSPEFTVVEDYLEPTLDTASSKPLFAEPESNKGGIFKDRVCVPSTGFYGGIILILIFCAVILVLLINSRKSLVHKFNY